MKVKIIKDKDGGYEYLIGGVYEARLLWNGKYEVTIPAQFLYFEKDEIKIIKEKK